MLGESPSGRYNPSCFAGLAAPGLDPQVIGMNDQVKQLDLDRPRSSLKHPPGLFLLFIVEMWERFSYYGMRGLLVLYLVGKAVDTDNPGRGWDEGAANLLYGWYTGLAYLFPLIGGYLADRFLGTHRSIVIGGVLIALGHIVLGITGLGKLGTSPLGMSLFIGGLALIILGTGYFKPCSAVMVGQLYEPQDPRRDGAFTIYYMGVNLGAFLCSFVCGTLGEKVGWHWGFGSAAVGMLAGLSVYLLYRPRYLSGIGLPPEGRERSAAPAVLFVLPILLSALVVGIYQIGGFAWFSSQVSDLFSHPTLGNGLKIGILLLVLGLVAWFVSIQAPGEKGPTASIFLFMIFNAFFWLAYEQAGSTLNIFAEKSTDRNLWGWEMPATWFQSVNAALILILAPFFAELWSRLGQAGKNPSQPLKISLGLLLLGIGYVFMVCAARLNATGLKVSIFWLTATYFFHTLGELCISPTGLSFVTKIAPVRFVSLLMGCWYIANFMANLGGGYVASYVKRIEQGELDLPWYQWFRLGGRADYFFIFVLSSVGTGLLILVLTPLLKRLYGGKE